MKFSSVYKFEKDGCFQMMKFANINELETTINQIQYLQQLPNDLKQYFPKVLEYYVGKNTVWYTMPFYSMNSLNNIICDKSIDLNLVKKVFEVLIDIIFDKLYNNIIGSVSNDYAEAVYFSRIKKRIKYICDKRPDLAALVTNETIVINGKEYYNALCLLKKIEKTNIVKKSHQNFSALFMEI